MPNHTITGWKEVRESPHSRQSVVVCDCTSASGVGDPVKSDLDPTRMIFIFQYDSDPKHIM